MEAEEGVCLQGGGELLNSRCASTRILSAQGRPRDSPLGGSPGLGFPVSASINQAIHKSEMSLPHAEDILHSRRFHQGSRITV